MTGDDKQNPQPQAAAAPMKFDVLKAAIRDAPTAARLGRLAIAARRTVDTPNYFAITSRGVVPHVTPDNLAKHLSDVGGAYMALEDFIERPQQYLKRPAPILQTPSLEFPYSPALGPRPPLHSFTAMPPSVITVLAARRLPAVPAPMGNTNSSVSVFTSTGFQVLTTREYADAVSALRPDIAVPMADLTDKALTPTSKRATRMAERTDDWVKEWFAQLDASNSSGHTGVATFAPVLPVGFPMQWEYLERLSEDYVSASTTNQKEEEGETTRKNHLAGLALYDADVIPDLEDAYPNLTPLPRLSLANPTTPHHVLRQIALGVDVFALPFINTVSDAGVALTFTFPPPPPSSDPSVSRLPILPLGIDMSSPTAGLATDTGPLLAGCACYACARHHRAYVHHLLAAREMLGWTLLQAHNHGVASAFFAGVRAALRAGPAAYDAACRTFAAVYEPEFPAGTGERPRARGYQYAGGAGEPKRNKPAWGKLGGPEDDVAAVEQKKPRGGKTKNSNGAIGTGNAGADIVDGSLAAAVEAVDLQEAGAVPEAQMDGTASAQALI
ncbi:tRNA-guanine(15) transglycosylase-like protein [Lasiosphaeria miniovina]|uniref:Queuine tRNA-ribosyltransferase accessory subunit 2 n=1 Tax=Lasiosphaeria miniovina TaxID=1954250 RepID=A0AA40B6W0_9PEZI|nr:tRNA-guanine(15) transglycosylase-like protein [Lasiosphaeria miniovina]KAK0728393.1 tRNA-guanine(15) transglycosylase-like protein [Lasiosphaeria miniovina]